MFSSRNKKNIMWIPLLSVAMYNLLRYCLLLMELEIIQFLELYFIVAVT